MKLVIVESPYNGPTKLEIDRNKAYARRAMHDCFLRGEAPFASHLLYTQPGVLRDSDPEERKLGIKAGLEWGMHAEATVVYADLGISSGMQHGIDIANKLNRPIEYRRIGQQSVPQQENPDDEE